jgi:hypothetical protein
MKSYAPAGGTIWLLLVAAVRPGILEESYGQLILAFAALVVVPLGVSLVARDDERDEGLLERRLAIWIDLLVILAAMGLMMGVFRGETRWFGLWALPWGLLCGAVALWGSLRGWRYRRGPLAEWVIAAGMIHLAVGGGWALLDRWGMQPLGFQRSIVLLTAIHFHFAGFALPLLAGLAMRRAPSRLAAAAGMLVVASVPLTAVGITATQLGANPVLETLTAACMAAGGLLVAAVYARLAVRGIDLSVASRIAWGMAALTLGAGMGLALLYGIRFYLPIERLDIPWMRAVHGSLNAFGFTLVGLLGWQWVSRRREV